MGLVLQAVLSLVPVEERAQDRGQTVLSQRTHTGDQLIEGGWEDRERNREREKSGREELTEKNVKKSGTHKSCPNTQRLQYESMSYDCMST